MSVKAADYLNRKLVEAEAHRQLENCNGTVTAVEVASALFPLLIQYVGHVMEIDNQLRIADSQDEIPYLGVRFTLD